jgi:hypothetical protein
MFPSQTAPAGRADGARARVARAYAAYPILPLAELADFFAGFPIEEARKNTDKKVYLLQAQDLATGQIPPEPPRAIIANLPPQQVLCAGDVILAVTAHGYRAMVAYAPLLDTVCAAPLLVIRITDQAKLDPDWLCCFLQTSTVQSLLARFAAQDDSHEALLEGLDFVKLPLPEIGFQKTLVQMATEYRAMEAAGAAALARLRQNNESIWLALARGDQESVVEVD